VKGAQLALPVQLQQVPGFDNFFAGPNADVVEALRAQTLPAVWLFGAPSSGRTHLLRAALRARDAESGYVSHGLPADESAPLLAIDDAESLLADRGTAIALLRLIDRRRQSGLAILLAAGAPPARLDIALPDLRTRLEAMALLGLKPLRESDRRELLQLHAMQRGLELPDEVTAWLLAHLRRDAGTLIAALEEIDRATLSAKRRPTLPFVQQALGPLLQPALAL
jgi:DnaA-homolog protein